MTISIYVSMASDAWLTPLGLLQNSCTLSCNGRPQVLRSRALQRPAVDVLINQPTDEINGTGLPWSLCQSTLVWRGATPVLWRELVSLFTGSHTKWCLNCNWWEKWNLTFCHVQSSHILLCPTFLACLPACQLYVYSDESERTFSPISVLHTHTLTVTYMAKGADTHRHKIYWMHLNPITAAWPDCCCSICVKILQSTSNDPV